MLSPHMAARQKLIPFRSSSVHPVRLAGALIAAAVAAAAAAAAYADAASHDPSRWSSTNTIDEVGVAR